MLIVFFDTEGVVRAEFMPRGTTVNSEYYKGLLERLRNDVRRKRPKSGRTDLCCFMTTLRVTRLSSSASFWLIKKLPCPHPPYSPDLVPCDFWLLPKIKLTMKGNRFDTIPEIEAAMKERLGALTKDDFQSCQDRWIKCINNKGEYFEGD
jgi:hypothetical protein